MNYQPAVLVPILVILCTGCFDTSREFNAVKRDVVNTLDVSVEERQSFGLGRLSLGLARSILSLAPDEDDDEAEFASKLIGTVRKVEVGCYQIDGEFTGGATETLRLIDQTMLKAGLEPMVRHAESGELVTIYIELKDDQVRQMFVVSVDGSELVLLRLRGRLDEAVTLALNADF